MKAKAPKGTRFLYLIICSRGVGSETITVSNVTRAARKFVTEEVVETLSRGTVAEVETDFADEGYVIAIPPEAGLADIYNLILKIEGEQEQDYEQFIDDSPKAVTKNFRELMDQLTEQKKKNHSAFISACLRAFLANENIKEGKDIDSAWTSCNAWRNLELECLNLKQFEAIAKATGQTFEQLGKWDCKVLQAAAKEYKQTPITLATRKPFQGC